MNDSTRLLVIYLQDHDAAAQAGQALARRCARSNAGTDLGSYLSDRFLPQIESEQAALAGALTAVSAAPSQLKRTALRVGEAAGRLKANGRIRSYSPLSRVIELEALIAGVHAKQRLWTSIETLTGSDGHRSLPDVSAHRQRAESQLEELQRHHTHAAATAFSPSSEQQ